MAEERTLAKLIADGFVRRDHARCVPADRWHAALARAALTLMTRGQDLKDLRVPVAWALSEAYAASSTDDELVEMVAVMTALSAVPPRAM